jgi:purine-binding chemotaxis protein CheW
MTTGLYATFVVEDRYLGVPVERVQEVLRAQPLTPVPLAHEHICGLVNLRGQIVTAVDLRARLGLLARDASAASADVVVTTEDGPVCLVVDRLGDVRTVNDDSFERPPNTLQAPTPPLIKGAFKLDDALLLDLDLDATVALTDRENG